jgi:hypothetical protein
VERQPRFRRSDERRSLRTPFLLAGSADALHALTGHRAPLAHNMAVYNGVDDDSMA